MMLAPAPTFNCAVVAAVKETAPSISKEPLPPLTVSASPSVSEPLVLLVKPPVLKALVPVFPLTAMLRTDVMAAPALRVPPPRAIPLLAPDVPSEASPLPAVSVPALMTVPPVYELVPESVVLPVPLWVTDVLPEIPLASELATV